MRCERISLEGDPAAAVTRLRALVPDARSVSDEVAKIIARVREWNDAAVLDYTRALDIRGVAEPRPLRVADDELDAAAAALDPAVRHGLARAIANVEAVAAARAHRETTSVDLGTHVVCLGRAPVWRAGIYVPGGRAPYPSTVVMGVVPARVAGVREILVCSPPGPEAEVNPTILGAARLAGATAVYRMGGAQAIAALAYGTDAVAPVDVIAGPGNLYVQEAKRQVFGQVGIDGFAGPSDLLVIADRDADVEPLALDLLAQAEHGPGTLVIAASPEVPLLDALAVRLEEGSETGALAALVEVADMDAALAFADAFAPEHLQLAGVEAEELAPGVTRAGCVFVGELSGTAFGDYIAGSNHILPTGGAARYASALSPEHFLRATTEVRVTDGSELAREASPVARSEGFDVHARSMEARIRDNHSR
jgi:histidinol dehydrogenase